MNHITWRDALGHPTNRKYALVVGLSLVAMFCVVFFTLAYTEERKGYVIEQWFGRFYGQPINFSILVLILTYFSMGYAVFSTVRQPILFLQLLSAYSIMQFMRVGTLLLVPLDPPENILPLNDPFLQNTFYAGRANLKDLFFSGHVATICIVAMFAKHKRLKGLFWIIGAAVGLMLIQQRVHYISDVAAAPIFAWLAVRLSTRASTSIS